MKEIFKTVVGFDRYLVSNFGRVISTARKVKELKPQKDAVGYYHVRLYPEDYSLGSYGKGRGKRPKLYKVHRLVAETFISNDDPKNKVEINHKDGNKANNHVDNLEWISREDNMYHSWSTGLHANAAYKGAEKRRFPCYAVHPDGTKEYFLSRLHAAIAFNTTSFTVLKSIQKQKPVTRFAAKGILFVDLDELPPGETFKQILNIEQKLIEYNNKYYPKRKVYQKAWREKRKKRKK